MQSNIKIRLKFRCIIGLLEHEREQPQRVQLRINARGSEFLDYAQVAKKAKKYLKKKRFKTLEKALEKLCAKLKNSFSQITYLHVQIFKLDIIKNARVGCYLSKSYET